MQIAGGTCFVCHRRIGTVYEAVGCGTCELFAHRRCAESANCPRCQTALLSGLALHRTSSRDHLTSDATLGPLFPAAVHKFILLSSCTTGGYTLYWTYHNWRRIENASGEGLSPFWRTVFDVLWVSPLLGRIRVVAQGKGLAVWWPHSVLGGLSIVLSLCLRLPDPWWLISGAAIVPLLPAVATCWRVNREAGDPEGTNGRYSLGNVIVVVGGGLCLGCSSSSRLGHGEIADDGVHQESLVTDSEF